jgi:hypothetical protein
VGEELEALVKTAATQRPAENNSMAPTQQLTSTTGLLATKEKTPWLLKFGQ